MTDAMREEILTILGLPRVLRSFQESQTVKRIEALITRARVEEREASFKDGYLAGFMASGEGWNGEYPHATKERYLADKYWIGRRDNALNGYSPKRDDG